jgi:hypothetical protein
MEKISRRVSKHCGAGEKGSGPEFGEKRAPKFEKQERRGSTFQSFEFEFQFTNLEVLGFVMKTFSFLLSVIVYVL